MPGDGEHDRAAAFAHHRVREPDDRDLGDVGVRVQDVLDLLGRDVLALADDDVLQPPGDRHEAVGVDPAEVSRPEEAVRVERLRVAVGVQVPGADHHAAGADLAHLVGAADAPVVGDHAQLDARHGPALGRRELGAGVAHGRDDEERRLGQPVDGDRPDAADLVLQLGVQPRWLGCGTGHDGAGAGKARCSGCARWYCR